jgi:DNA-binding CsgD family transcriptional regulator
MQPRERLTAKEMQVAALVWEGQTNREIAKAIGTTEQVVKNYLRNTFDKLGVWSRLELAIYVARHGGERWREDLRRGRLISCPGRLLLDRNGPASSASAMSGMAIF